ncbi:MAG: phosphoenolpyruvate--protein phosphotransferase [Gammaproteobacteria bacterium]|nr:phosphoenolpyruvate--protein phosphotransferase [Gammaproteobacteria bacterium]
MPMIINGIGVSRGITQGWVHVLKRGETHISKRTLEPDQIGSEVERLNEALEESRKQLREVRDMVPEKMRQEVTGFLDAHLLMLDDAMLVDMPAETIRAQSCNAEWALEDTLEQLVAVFDSMEDAYLRTRKNDVQHVIRKVQENLSETEEGEAEVQERDLTGRIVVADDLTPADTVLIQHQNVAAFVTQFGSSMSHTAILARSLQIPAVVGLHDAGMLLEDGELVLIDGHGGTILCADDANWLVDQYREYQRAEQEREEKLMALRDKPTITRDKQSVTLKCNIDLIEEIPHVHEVQAEGVGLYRTEFFYLDRPEGASTDEQYEVYRDLVVALDGKPLTIRTLDLGADKEFDPDYEGAIAPNPALGLRAIRRSLQNKPVFMAQLRAILRASAHGPVHVMLPMLTNSSELSQSLALIRDCMEELGSEGAAYDPEIKIGGMIEVPAAAISASVFAHHLDFLSIGTNDLIQYTLAIDRVDDQVHYLFDPLHPAVLFLIHHTIQAGRQAGTPVSMCGEMASNPRLTRLLIGLGLREFSTHPGSLLEIKQIINHVSSEILQKQCQEILACPQPEKIHGMVEALAKA